MTEHDGAVQTRENDGGLVSRLVRFDPGRRTSGGEPEIYEATAASDGYVRRSPVQRLHRAPDFRKKVIKRVVGAVIGAVLVAAAVWLTMSIKSYPMDYDEAGKLIVDPKKMAIDSYKNAGMGLGFFVGWFLERRVIHFTTDVGRATRAVRFVLGAAIYYVVVEDLTPYISENIEGGLGKAAEQFVVVMFILVLMPLLFKLTDKLTRSADKKLESKK